MAETRDVSITHNLPTTTGSGSQATTQDPQTASEQPVNTANQTSDVQPSASNKLLTNEGGIPLTPTALPTANLNSTSVAATTAPAPVAVHHHPNGVLLGFSGLLFVVAIVLFWSTSRTAKNTTK